MATEAKLLVGIDPHCLSLSLQVIPKIHPSPSGLSCLQVFSYSASMQLASLVLDRWLGSSFRHLLMVFPGDLPGYCHLCTEDIAWYTGTMPEVAKPEVVLQRAQQNAVSKWLVLSGGWEQLCPKAYFTMCLSCPAPMPGLPWKSITPRSSK